MARCPGQDQRFWKPDDIFDVQCPVCRTSVEFWKDEPQVKCPGCTHIISNPKLDLGCAEWCPYGPECLGKISSEESGILSHKLIEYLRQTAGENQNIVRESLEILRYAEKIQIREGGNPLVVKASAILSKIYKPSFHKEDTTVHKNAPIHNLLTTHGITTETADHICRILSACQSDENLDSLEFHIIEDARQLALFHQQAAHTDECVTGLQWKTETARQMAQNSA